MTDSLTLAEYLDKNADRIKDSKQVILDILTKENMDLKEIMEFAEADLRATLQAANMSAKAIGRLINVLRHTPLSWIYKESQISKTNTTAPNAKAKSNRKSQATQPVVTHARLVRTKTGLRVNDHFAKFVNYQPPPRRIEDLFYDIQEATLMPSISKRMECLVMGYVAKSLYFKYPKDLSQLIMHYAGSVIFVFDLIHKKYQNCIQHEGTYIRRPGKYEQYTLPDWVYVTVGASIELNNVFTGFSIKCIQPRTDAIGIVSDISICQNKEYENKWCQKAPGNMYYYYGGGAISSGSNTKNRPSKQKNLLKWKRGDIVTIKFDANAYTVKFYLNGQQQGHEVLIEPGTYHPFIGTQYHDADYQIVDT